MASQVLGEQRIAAAALAAAVAPTLPAGTRYALLSADTAPIRFTLDGATTPTATVGLRLLITEPPYRLTLEMGLAEVKFILESGSPNLYLVYCGDPN